MLLEKTSFKPYLHINLSSAALQWIIRLFLEGKYSGILISFLLCTNINGINWEGRRG